MKRLLVLFLVISLSGIALASMEKSVIESKLISIVGGVKAQAISCSTFMGDSLNDAIDIVQIYGSELIQSDKDNLQTLKTKVQTANIALDDVILYINTNWKSID